MNGKKILEMIRPFVKNGQLTYENFDEIFKFLSQKEKYLVADFLNDNLKIILVDEEENFSATQEDFKFVDYVLAAVQPYVENQQLTYDEFDKIFSHLEKRVQYKATDILAASSIELVDKKILPAQVELQTEKIFSTQPKNIVLHKDYEITASNAILVKLAQNGDMQALQDLIVKNRGLILKYANRYDKIYNHNLDIEDLEQEGTLGMMKAVEDFDLSKGTQFSTYAVYWIKQYIYSAVCDSGFTIRLPTHIFESLNKINTLDRKFSLQEENFSARIELIANAWGISCERVRELISMRNNYFNVASLDVPAGEESDTELVDFIPDSSTPTPFEMLEKEMLKETLVKVLDTLTDSEKQVLMLRFGLKDGKARTLGEVSKNFKVTRERIRQIEAKALRKLRHPSRSKKLKDFLY